jgi:hypothetical protein
MGGSSAGSGNNGGGGSPNQMAKDKAAKDKAAKDKAAKDKAAKDKAVRDKEDRQKEIREEQNNKQKVTVPEKKTYDTPGTLSDPKEKKVTVPEKKTYDTPGTLSDPKEKDDTAAKMSLFKEQGATDLKNTEVYTPATAILSAVAGPASRYNRDYFANEVLGKGAYKETTKQDFEKMSRTSQESLYSGYMSGRQSGKTDAYGNPVPQGDNGGVPNSSGGPNGNKPINQVTKTAPTTAEVSQATTAAAKPTETAETTASNRLLKIKKRGRSQSIMTSSKGVTKTSANYSLGKKSLLGKV